MVTNRQIKKWNDYFESLSPENKRVAIAKDVIAQMKINKIDPCSGVYFDINDGPEDQEISLQKYLPETTCNVCALGALFYSHIKFNNKVTYKNYYDVATSDLIVNKLKDYFSFEQMCMIETSFEGFNIEVFDEIVRYNNLSGIVGSPSYANRYDTIDDELKLRLQESFLYYEHLSSKDTKERYENFRLFQIMSNIIRNNGTFVPTDLTIEKWKTTKKTTKN